MTALLIIVSYLSLLIVLGLGANRLFRGTASDYMLASHSIGPFLLLMSLFGTTMTSFALVGSTGYSSVKGVAVYGLMASSSGIVHSLCFFFIGVKLWSLGRRHGYTTQIEFFRDRLASRHIGLVLFPVLVAMVMVYLLGGVLGGGAVVSEVTAGAFESAGWFASYNYGVPTWLASLVICLVVLVYVFFGGMRGTAWANTFQTLVFMILGVITFGVIAKGVGGQESLFASLEQATAGVPEKLRSTSQVPRLSYLGFLLVPASVGMFPHVFQHWLTARSAKAFKVPIVAHPIFIMIVWVPCVLIGIWSRSPAAGLPVGTDPNHILAAMVANFASPVLGGLLTAGILAAVMSSLDSQFLCLGTMFTRDVVVHHFGEERFSDRQKVALARGFVVAIVAITYVCSLIVQPGVFQLGVWCFSGFTALVPLALAALYWRRVTSAGAYACVVTTLVVWSYLFVDAEFGMNPNYTFLGLMAVIPLTICSTVALVAVSLFTRPPDAQRLTRFFPERYGMKGAEAVSPRIEVAESEVAPAAR